MGLPHGWSIYEAGDIGAIPSRANNLIECSADIGAYFRIEVAQQTETRAQLECAYCGDRARLNRDDAYAWFRNHPCRIDEIQASRNRRIMAARDSKPIAA